MIIYQILFTDKCSAIKRKPCVKSQNNRSDNNTLEKSWSKFYLMTFNEFPVPVCVLEKGKKTNLRLFVLKGCV